MTDLITKTYADHRRDFLDKLPESFIPAIEAERFVNLLRDDYPEVLLDWLTTHAVTIVGADFAKVRARARQTLARDSSSRRFSEAAKAGEVTRDMWAIPFRVAEDDTQRRLGSMTGADHFFVADTHAADSKREAMLASFHRAVGKKVGKRTTEEVFTPEKFLALRESITGDAA